MGRYRRSDYGYGRNDDRFPNYAEIAARFDSDGYCGHSIKQGDRIGYHRGLKRTRCATCWARWVSENEASDFDEMVYASGY